MLHPNCPSHPRRWPGGIALALGLWIGVFASISAFAQPDNAPPHDPPPTLAQVQRRFGPAVVRMAHERRVIHADALTRLCENPEQQARVQQWLVQHGIVVLNSDQGGLTLHYFAEGIETMTPADRLWEGLPVRADTLQQLVDHAITQARQTGRPIGHLIVTGHAGLPGCAAWGGTLDDCTFRGELTGYQRLQLRRLQPYLAPDAEIELRQCATGSGARGELLLRSIHHITGVTASSYLGDFHFGDSTNHPRIRFSDEGVSILSVR